MKTTIFKHIKHYLSNSMGGLSSCKSLGISHSEKKVCKKDSKRRIRRGGGGGRRKEFSIDT